MKSSTTRRTGRGRTGLFAVVVVGLLAAACGDDGGSDATRGSDDESSAAETVDDGRTGANPAGCIEDAAQSDDLFPDRFEPAYAENLNLEYHDTYKVLTVVEPAPGLPSEHYVLVQCGTEVPDLEDDLADATVVEVPVRSVFSESSSHLGFLDTLGAADVVTGVAVGDTVVAESVRERVDAGDATSFAPDFEVDAEVVLLAGPDAFVTGGGHQDAYTTLAEGGIPVLANAEWLETSPLGWAEWIGFFAALTNTEARANQVFGDIEQGYEEVMSLAADVDERPVVLAGSLFEGEWLAPGGAGIVARFITDAGGDYIHADTSETGSLTIDIEQALLDGRDADVWLAPNEPLVTRADARNLDERYLEFAAWDHGGVWDDNVERDGVSKFEHGPVMVDVMLLDYLKVLHPALAEDHELMFFEAVAIE